ncbi:MAG: pyridoxamine 5'-phosphate oxidase family protein [Roseicyclus sp.]
MNAHHDVDTAKLRDALFDALESEHAGMLGVSGTGKHMQPMTHFTDREAGCLWFITSRETELARHLESGAREAHFTLTTSNGKLYACMSGFLARVHDSAKLDEIWSPMASMWFDGGKDDPDVLLLQLRLDEAEVWLVEAGALRLGIEMVRGAMSEHDPDVGEHGVVNLRAAA